MTAGGCSIDSTGEIMAPRVESDSIGTIKLPAQVYWGAQTERARTHFAIDKHRRMPAEVIHALALVKEAAALVNEELGLLDFRRASLIVAVADEIRTGRLDDHFPLGVWQSGSGTQTNMNV